MIGSVGIIGAGPAGLLLAHLLHARGIHCVVFERHNREHVENRIRAGVLETTTVKLLQELGIADRLSKQGLVHSGFSIAVEGDLFRIDLAALTGGSTVVVYGQTEITKDLIQAGLDRGIDVRFDACVQEIRAQKADRITLDVLLGGTHREFAFDFVAGCDGYHGVGRNSAPNGTWQTFERAYPSGWLGILADVRPPADELIYAKHARGFALASMRSTSRSRYYIQVPSTERLEDWPDQRIWDELAVRLGPNVSPNIERGKSIEKSIAPLRSFVCEPLQYGRLFLAGDAAHIVPPTGAKGLNLAVSDVKCLAEGLDTYYASGSTYGLENYSDRALRRIWGAERFSWWFTSLLHEFPEMSEFDRKIQAAEIAHLRHSRSARAVLAQNYVGVSLG